MGLICVHPQDRQFHLFGIRECVALVFEFGMS